MYYFVLNNSFSELNKSKNFNDYLKYTCYQCKTSLL